MKQIISDVLIIISVVLFTTFCLVIKDKNKFHNSEQMVFCVTEQGVIWMFEKDWLKLTPIDIVELIKQQNVEVKAKS